MKKILMTLAAVFCCAMSVQAQLLYKISGGGLKEPSYILGSNHTAAISFVDSIPGLLIRVRHGNGSIRPAA